MDITTDGPYHVFMNCRLMTQSTITAFSGNIYWYGGGLYAQPLIGLGSGQVNLATLVTQNMIINGTAQANPTTLFQGARVQGSFAQAGVFTIVDCGFMDWPAGAAVECGYGMSCMMFNSPKLWGNSAVAGSYTFSLVWGSHHFIYQSGGLAGITAKGAGNAGTDFKIGAFIAGPVFDPTTNTWSAATQPYTLAKLKGTTATDFNGYAWHPQYGGGIMQSS